MKWIIGADEVGRGPIAGPVTVCVFLMKVDYDALRCFKNRRLCDSKKLSPVERVRIHTELELAKQANYIDFVVVSKSASHIDKYGINQAISVCLEEGLTKLLVGGYNLDRSVTKIELDGSLKLSSRFIDQVYLKYNQLLEYTSNIRGDENIPAIACASIVAKVLRDRYMHTLAKKTFTESGRQYVWASNVGYGTPEHYKLIEEFGLTLYHRKTFLKKLVTNKAVK